MLMSCSLRTPAVQSYHLCKNMRLTGAGLAWPRRKSPRIWADIFEATHDCSMKPMNNRRSISLSWKPREPYRVSSYWAKFGNWNPAAVDEPGLKSNVNFQDFGRLYFHALRFDQSAAVFVAVGDYYLALYQTIDLSYWGPRWPHDRESHNLHCPHSESGLLVIDARASQSSWIRIHSYYPISRILNRILWIISEQISFRDWRKRIS